MRSRRGHLGRAAILAIGAASVGAAVVACSGDTTDRPNETVDYGTVVGIVDASTAADGSTGDAAPPMGIASYGTVVGIPVDAEDGGSDGGDGGGDASHEDASFDDGGDGGDAGT